MAIQQTDGTSYVIRSGYGDYPDNTGDWTIFLQFRYTNTPTGIAQILKLYRTGNSEFVKLISTNNTLDILLSAENHATSTDATTSQVVVVNTYNTVAVTYEDATHIFSLIVNGSVVDTATLNMSASVFDILTMLADSGGTSSPNVSLCYFRGWSNLLSNTELTAEGLSILAVKQTGLLWDCPLQASIDLTSHNNTLNQLTAVSTATTVITDLTDPLLSVVAGPPTNTSPNTATEITADSAYFQSVATAGVATDVWFKYQTIESDDVIGMDAFGDVTTYKPALHVYQGLANALANNEYPLFGSATNNFPIQTPLPVTFAGDIFYYKAARNGAVSPSTLQVSLVRALKLTVPIGSIGVNEESEGWPVAFLDSTTLYPIRFVRDFTSGEGGATISDGRTIFADDANHGNYIIYNADLSVKTTITLNSEFTVASGNQIDTFVAGRPSISNPHARIIASDGTLDPTIYILADAPATIGLNADKTIFYYGSSAGIVHRWDVVNNVALSDLAAAISGYSLGQNEIVVLSDGSIVVAYIKVTATKNYKILVYNPDGTILSTCDLGTLAFSTNRTASAIDNPSSYWSWIKQVAGGPNLFKRIRTSDGTVLFSGPSYEYDFGIYQHTNDTLNSIVPWRFGHADSCPFWLTRVALFPGVTTRSGIYYLTGTGVGNPTQRHDTLWIDASVGTTEDVKIP